VEKSLPPAPEVVPLPFTIPVAEDSDGDDDGSSILTLRSLLNMKQIIQSVYLASRSSKTVWTIVA
jgi:hypothetical protein